MTPAVQTRLLAIHVGDDAESWRGAGFAATERAAQATVDLGGVRLVLHGAEGPRGLLGWTLSPSPDADIDGLPTWADTSEAVDGPTAHPNRVNAIDHLVIGTPDLDRTTRAFARQGWVARRTMHQPDLGRTLRFFLLGSGPGEGRLLGSGPGEGRLLGSGPGEGRIVVEVMQPDAPTSVTKPARFWGLALVCEDLGAVAELLGPDVLGRPRDAVQPGRRIATLRTDALGISLPLALLSPRP